MSTKIFNGYVLGFLAIAPMYEIDLWGNELRRRIQNVQKYLHAKRIADLSALLVDRIALLDDPGRLLAFVNGMLEEERKELNQFLTPYGIAFENLSDCERKIRTTHQRDPINDFECDVQILHVPGRNLVLAMLFAEQDMYRVIWEHMPGVREYAYWNNTDKPSYVTEEQWARRGRDWDKALGRDGIPSLHGFGIQCHATYSHATYSHAKIEEILRTLPSFAQRVRRQAQDTSFRRWLDDRELTTDNFFALRSEYREWAQTTTGRLVTARLWHEVAHKLPEQITKEMLLEPVTSLYEQMHLR